MRIEPKEPEEWLLECSCNSFENFVDFCVRIDITVTTKLGVDQVAVDGDLKGATGLLGRLASDVQVAQLGREFVRNLS